MKFAGLVEVESAWEASNVTNVNFSRFRTHNNDSISVLKKYVETDYGCDDIIETFSVSFVPEVFGDAE